MTDIRKYFKSDGFTGVAVRFVHPSRTPRRPILSGAGQISLFIDKPLFSPYNPLRIHRFASTRHDPQPFLGRLIQSIISFSRDVRFQKADKIVLYIEL